MIPFASPSRIAAARPAAFAAPLRALALCAALSAGCAAKSSVAESPPPPPPPASVRVVIVPSTVTLSVGDTITLRAFAVSASADTVPAANVEWRSANPALATISATGTVRAVATGLAGIAAHIRDGVGAARVVVVPPSRATPAGNAPDVRRLTTAAAPPPATPPRSRVAASPPSRTSRETPAESPARQAPAVAPPGAREGPHPHEPEGFRVLANRAFTSKAERDDDRGDDRCRGGSECWDGIEYRYNKFRIITDSSAPVSCCTIARMVYPPTHKAGTAPATVQTKSFSPRVDELYISIWARISPNWSGNGTGTNKMFFVGFGSASNNIFLSAEGAGLRPLQAQIRMQGVDDSRARIRPNVRPNAQILRGRWQHWELYLKLNDPGVANGIARLWIDGELVTDARDVKYRGRDRSRAQWWIFHWSPTYGGGGSGPPSEQYLDFDHVYVSGR